MNEPHSPVEDRHPAEGNCGGDHDQNPCQQALHELYTYLDGWVEAGEQQILKGHLDDCPPCHDVFSFHDRLHSMVHDTCQCDVPDDVRARILEALAACDPEASPS